jgi:hypothetical protein
MQLKLFILPIKNLGAAEAEMNAFLRGHRVLAVKKEFVPDGENSFWTFCVEYLDGGGSHRRPYQEAVRVTGQLPAHRRGQSRGVVPAEDRQGACPQPAENDKTLLLTLRGAGRIAFGIFCISAVNLGFSGQIATIFHYISLNLSVV